jgi:predicted  nucleic acid-binding Zn ribbon protein
MTEALSKFQPPLPTPVEELCQCRPDRPWKLMSALGYNPIACLDCNREIPLARLELPNSLLEQIAAWRSLWDAIDRLWLASGAYEAWAAAQLNDLSSPVNCQGRALVTAINDFHLTYYWHATDRLVDDPVDRLVDCPCCTQPLTLLPETLPPQVLCQPCWLVAAHPSF